MSQNSIPLPGPDLVELTAGIVSAYVAKNAVQGRDIIGIIDSVHKALAAIANPAGPVAPEHFEPAVPVRKSVTPDFIISLEDGKRYKTLRRHLATLGLTPEAYRAKWDLPFDYPMVAPAYAKARSELARSIGLGRKRTQEPTPAKAPPRKASATAADKPARKSKAGRPSAKVA